MGKRHNLKQPVVIQRIDQSSRPALREGAGRWLLLASVLTAALLLMTSGCRVLQGAADLPGQTVRTVTGGTKKSAAPDPVELQEQLVRFADDYSGRLLVASDSLNATTNVINPADLIRLKLNCIGGCFAVATGPNATMNLLRILMAYLILMFEA